MSRADLNLVECIQGTQEWFDSRIGMLTASRIADALRRAKRESTGELETRKKLRLELAVERLTKKPADNYVSNAMARGTELEPMARAAYELRTDRITDSVGFVLHPDRVNLEWAGASPDGLIGDNGLVEFKCPLANTHAEYLLGEVVPNEYVYQMMWQMACCPGYEWCDFVSYHPDFPEPLDLFVCRLPRDNRLIADMEVMAAAFLSEVADTVERIKGGLEPALRKSLAVQAPGSAGRGGDAPATLSTGEPGSVRPAANGVAKSFPKNEAAPL